MKKITTYINERLQLGEKISKHQYEYFPKNRRELVEAIRDEVKKYELTESNNRNSINLNIIDTSQITDMEDLFMNIRLNKLKTVKIDISEWNVSNVKTMRNMFCYRNFLTSIGDISRWGVSSVEDMHQMFCYCEELKNIDVSNWNVSNVKTMEAMFAGCWKLTSIGDISNWDIRSLKTSMNMFNACKKLKTLGDLSNWNISNVTNMQYMFANCYNLEYVGDLKLWYDKNKKYKTTQIFLKTKKLENKPSWYIEY